MDTDAAPQPETGTVHKGLKINSHVQETVTGFGRINGIDDQRSGKQGLRNYIACLKACTGSPRANDNQRSAPRQAQQPPLPQWHAQKADE